MSTEQQAQAKHLYFQTDMSKTQIAALLSIPRRTLHYWIREKNWDRVKKSAAHMPSILAEKCYHLIAQFSDQLLSEDRLMKPITHQEADTLHKLTITAGKLKNRSTLNESMEMFGFFMERVNQKSPELADAIAPIMNEYISSRASINIADFRPDNFSNLGLIPQQKPDLTEAQLDLQDIAAWTDANKPAIDLDQLRPNEQSAATATSPNTEVTPPGDTPPTVYVTSPAPEPALSDSRSGKKIEQTCPTGYTTSPSPLGEGRGEASPGETEDQLVEMYKSRSIGLDNKPHIDTFHARARAPHTKEEYRAYLRAEQEVYDAILSSEAPHAKDKVTSNIKEAA